MGEVFRACEEADEGTALPRDVVADRSPQDRIVLLQSVEDRPSRGGGGHIHPDLPRDLRQRAQMRRQDHPDHARVWTSTENTDGRSRTIGAQLSPPSAEA